jgi:diacylglycerol kinase (ATP)
MRSEVLFIVNPISGTGKQKKIAPMLKQHLDQTKFKSTVVFTQYPAHATEISRDASVKFPFVVAVGGDGTVNEVARGLVESNAIMGIIPIGSGNGLARHLNLPLDISEAIKVFNKQLVQSIDTASINGQRFVNVAGIGFDAHIAHLYSAEKKRGPIPYIKIATTEFQSYKAKEYQITIEGKCITEKAFLISFANSSQFGNNAYISPHALINDGLLDICILKEFPMVEAPQLAVKLFNKRLDKSRYMKIIRATKVKLISDQVIKGHLDGEPVCFSDVLDINIHPSSLQVIYNETVPVRTLIETEVKKVLNAPQKKLKEISRNVNYPLSFRK